jgi:outer membrane lipoprotein SlyB
VTVVGWRWIAELGRCLVASCAAMSLLACESLPSESVAQELVLVTHRKDVPPYGEVAHDIPSRLPWRVAEFETSALEPDRLHAVPTGYFTNALTPEQQPSAGEQYGQPSSSRPPFRQPYPGAGAPAADARATTHSNQAALPNGVIPGIVIGGIVGHRLGGGHGRIAPTIAGSVVGAAIAGQAEPVPCPYTPGSLIGFGALFGGVAGNVLSSPGHRTMNTLIGATAGSWLAQLAERGCARE